MRHLSDAITKSFFGAILSLSSNGSFHSWGTDNRPIRCHLFELASKISPCKGCLFNPRGTKHMGVALVTPKGRIGPHSFCTTDAKEGSRLCVCAGFVVVKNGAGRPGSLFFRRSFKALR